MAALVPELQAQKVASLAIGLLHAYANPDHERRVRDILAKHLPGHRDQPVERGLRRGARVRSLLDHRLQRLRPAADGGYLERLSRQLKETGLACPLYLMLSGGGLATLETAMRFPIRLVEWGPAGGAILAAGIARESDLPRVLSFDMGGTTAKICLIDDFRPQASRSFEIGRIYRFLKGSGLPGTNPRADLDHLDHGDAHRQAAALHEAVNAADLEAARGLAAGSRRSGRSWPSCRPCRRTALRAPRSRDAGGEDGAAGRP